MGLDSHPAIDMILKLNPEILSLAAEACLGVFNVSDQKSIRLFHDQSLCVKCLRVQVGGEVSV
jgi:hypothetical protein